MTVWVVKLWVLNEGFSIVAVFASERLARDTYPCSFDTDQEWYEYEEFEVET